jgi:hypothetical protein
MRTLISALGLCLSGCASHVVRIPVLILPKSMPQSTEVRGLRASIANATATNAQYPRKLNNRKLTTYKPSFQPMAKTEEEALQSGISYLLTVGPVNAKYRRELEAKK